MSRQASGLKAWALQRFTAIYVGLYVLYLLGMFLFAAPADYAAWKGWLGSTHNGLAFLLFMAALLLHAWVGFRDVVLDYIKPICIRLGVLALLAMLLIVSAAWAIELVVLARVS